MTHPFAAWTEIDNGLVPVEDGELFYETAGDGPAVVLLHGGMLDQHMWDEQFSWLAGSGHRVIRYDFRGHGLSSTVSGDWANHDDLCALLDALDVPSAVLVGLSHGARVALDTALAHPERVGALALASPGVSGRAFTDPFVLEHIKGQVAAIGAPDGDGMERFVEHFLRMWVDGPHRRPCDVHPGLRERIRASAAANAEAHAEGMGAGMPLEVGAADRLSEIRVPTVVFDGDLDSGDIAANAHALALAVPGAHRVRIPGAAHMVNLENAAVFDQALRTFLSAVDGHRSSDIAR
ncbi:alpha/beta fold hydrolase [Streptomyces gilvosporeus]|uniref:Alpha/beta hydrolase n=1 Tax=Streptomyces gilvosporeus TaxID=553510 RepID=A0A1V0TR50_9ACTN|nr:alpha/beta hydrolase [Streptomyces gilvosporeus]ARF55142.1 alpha/beta hydrolase [Streptomyces gilvosporeus]